MSKPHASPLPLLPLLVFLALFLGVGTYLSLTGVSYAFYQLPAPVAVLPALIVAVLISRDSINKTVEQFLAGCGHSNIMAMCIIYLLSGAFGAVAKATGGVDATVALGLSLVPASLLLPGLFVIAAFIATAMGTSMGTIAALAPVALGLAQQGDLPLALTAGALLSGAMFGDNLSIISDTTIAATRTQGCDMKDKFRANFRLALPAAILTLLWLGFASSGSHVIDAKDFQLLPILPYVTILVLAVAGLNVFVVLILGIVLAGLVGLSGDYSLAKYVKDIYAGFTGMQEIFMLSLLMGGLAYLMEKQGGLAWLAAKLGHGSTGKNGELAIAGLVFTTNFCTANNTVSIIVNGQLAKDIAQQNAISPVRSASLLDIFACVNQGLVPWGAQALLLGSSFTLSPLAVVSHSGYVLVLAAITLATVLAPGARRLLVKH
ncbi:Na+/H+ antiporter NhaC family protein [Gallaecimonas pentaromativorans]|uniref:Putative methionine transporter (NhaC family) n=1 Tax=Gallaecimonas pentaromativorans TaxID=584787 RepID=A0A3N1PBB6_9GAMM|nr:Na+/H+ antiporter NhaC family protein [Gallaecimonas pentaromativorans]ROQ25915.1 putative methionine transporter (NhaC family) [Gallaecimonas pentaromativorans]